MEIKRVGHHALKRKKKSTQDPSPVKDALFEQPPPRTARDTIIPPTRSSIVLGLARIGVETALSDAPKKTKPRS
jgi:hypothetical protein